MKKISSLLIIILTYFCVGSTLPSLAQNSPILHIKRLINDKDLSGRNNVIEAEGVGVQENWSSLDNKVLKVKLENGIPTHELTIAFKFIPNSLNQSSLLVNAPFFTVTQSDASIKSAIKDVYGKQSSINNEANGLNLRSCNQFVLTIDRLFYASYLNANKVFIKRDVSKSMWSHEGAIEFGAFAGKLWDIQIYDRKLSDAEINSLSQKCNFTPVDQPYDKAYPQALCLPYICLWASANANINSEKFHYFLNQSENIFKHNIFNLGLYPTGTLE
ncbi:MAG: hypothetical protein O3B09_04520, partial [Proteobacteria bacterium]|nr:hypothetical protein [Pseudomonadota bacterium]